jgi:antitoxin YefM
VQKEGQMAHNLSMSEAREQLTRLPDKFDKEGETRAITVTRHGKPVLAVLPYELYESIMETLDVMGDPELMADLRQSIREIEQGSTISVDDLDRALGL